MTDKQVNISIDALSVSTSQKINITQIWNMVLIFLMTANAILAETIFETPHFILEILIILILVGLIVKGKLNKQELYLLGVFLFSQIGSFLINDLSVFMLNAKQLGLAVLGSIYFRRHAKENGVIHFIILLCIGLIFFQAVTGYFPLDIPQYMKYLGTDMKSRPLGLFLNYHFSAFLVAVYFLGLSQKRNVYFLDYITIYLIGVRTSLFSYIGQKIYNRFGKRLGIDNIRGQIIVIFLFVLMAIGSIGLLRSYYDKLDKQDNSLFVIAHQISQADTYIRMFSIFPKDIIPFTIGEIYDYEGMGLEGFTLGGNELFLVTLFVQSGFFLAVFFMAFLLKSLPECRFFILLSLLHYSFLFSPLVLYVFFMFKNEKKKSDPGKLYQAQTNQFLKNIYE